MARNDAPPFMVRGKQLHCLMCGHDKFWRDQASVEKGLGQFRPDREAFTLTCEDCKHIL